MTTLFRKRYRTGLDGGEDNLAGDRTGKVEIKDRLLDHAWVGYDSLTFYLPNMHGLL